MHRHSWHFISAILLLSIILTACVMPATPAALPSVTVVPSGTPLPKPSHTPEPTPTPTEVPSVINIEGEQLLVYQDGAYQPFEGADGQPVAADQIILIDDIFLTAFRGSTPVAVYSQETGILVSVENWGAMIDEKAYAWDGTNWVMTQDAEMFDEEMRQALEQGKQSFKIKDPNGMVITVDLPDSEENKASILEGESTWSWELRGFARINPKTGREQVMRFYYQESEVKRENITQRERWNDVADSINLPGWGKITLEGDIDALAVRNRLGRPAMRDFQFIKTEEAMARWIAGYTHLFGEQPVLDLLQPDSFTRAASLTESQSNLSGEPTNLGQSFSIEFVPSPDKKQGIDFEISINNKRASWYYRTESGRLVVTLYYASNTELFIRQRYINILLVAVLAWIADNPDYNAVSLAGKGRGIVSSPGFTSSTRNIYHTLQDSLPYFFDTPKGLIDYNEFLDLMTRDRFLITHN